MVVGVGGLLEKSVPVVRTDVHQIEDGHDVGGIAHAVRHDVALPGRPRAERRIDVAFQARGGQGVVRERGGGIHAGPPAQPN
jgi:hypothetical protein